MKTCQITHLNVPIIDVIKEMGGERRMKIIIWKTFVLLKQNKYTEIAFQKKFPTG